MCYIEIVKDLELCSVDVILMGVSLGVEMLGKLTKKWYGCVKSNLSGEDWCYGAGSPLKYFMSSARAFARDLASLFDFIWLNLCSFYVWLEQSKRSF